MKSDNHQKLTDQAREAATDIIRGKLDALYSEEPVASEEIAEIELKTGQQLSRHQLFMQNLTKSDKDMAEIQTAWHEYYQDLSDKEKHEVWQEFYSEHAKAKEPKPTVTHVKVSPQEPAAPMTYETKRSPRVANKRAAKTIKHRVLAHVQAQASGKDNHHVHSLIFGFSMGFVVLFVLLFSFFNERFITPFIRPSHNVSATPIIVDPNASQLAGPESKIIIPKINVEAPVVYDVTSIDEKAVQAGLERGVVHYMTTPSPGEKGNSVIVGHSSSNILNKGKYKFAFLLLKSLDKGDTFIIQKDSKRYVYKVYDKHVTSPTDVSVLGPTDRTATLTLITCDPPGTSTNRLIVQAEQIFPDPNANKASKVAPQKNPEKLPSNAPSLWQRTTEWF